MSLEEGWSEDVTADHEEALLRKVILARETQEFFAEHSVGKMLIAKLAQQRTKAAETLASQAMLLGDKERFSHAVQFEAANTLFRIIAETHNSGLTADKQLNPIDGNLHYE